MVNENTVNTEIHVQICVLCKYYMYSMGFFSSCRNIEQKSLNLTPRLIFCKWRRKANHAKETLYFQRLETY